MTSRGTCTLFRLAISGALLLGAGCFNDYGKFEVGQGGAEPGAGGASGGEGGSGGTGAGPAGGLGGVAGEAPGGGTGAIPVGGTGAVGGGGLGGIAGAPGGASGGPTGGVTGTGGVTCDFSQKLCDGECVPNDDPLTGCAETLCEACTAASGVVGCITGRCAITSCDPGRHDCNLIVDDGCEHDAATFDDANCGGCGNSCTAQGIAPGFTCSAGVCACTAPAQCGNRGTYDCTASGRCSCSGTECNPGESCRKVGSADVCGCNQGAACPAGQVCCQTPSGCFDLQTDPQNCGACGWACPDGQSCAAGVCAAL